MHVALYGPGGRFALTERGAPAVSRDERHLQIGRSRMSFDGTSLLVELDEVAAPVPQRVRGRIRLRPSAFSQAAFALDAAGRHRWWPIAPASQVEVELTSPALAWRGPAYFDTNAGSRPLEDDFASWFWCRMPSRHGAAVIYDVLRADGTDQVLSLDIARSGEVDQREPPPSATLPPGRLWRVERPTRADADASPRLVRTLEDTPFYTRSEVETRLFGESGRAVHESLSMTRFTRRWVQALLPFRMPRAP